MTQSRPGELFIVRNVGNIVPPHDAVMDKNSVAAALEFAVSVLKVADIIICGHSNCGAMKSLYQDESELANLPHLKEWITLAAPVKSHVERYYPEITGEKKERITEKENILEQLRNIETYPFASKALRENSIYLHGWYYDIGKGEILSYNPSTDKFERTLSSKYFAANKQLPAGVE